MASSFDSEAETPEMETLASLASNVVYRVPGCADVMVRKTIQDVYRDFCRRSCCLCGRRHFVVTHGDCDLKVLPLFGGVIDCISEVIYDGRKLRREDFAEVNGAVILSDRLMPDGGVAENYLPRVDVVFVEIPKVGSEQVPSWFVQKHGDSVCSGVLARLMMMTGKPWSDAAQAAVENVRYENAVNDERMRFYAGKSSGDCGTMSCGEELL